MHRREVEIIANTIRGRREAYTSDKSPQVGQRAMGALFAIDALAKDLAITFKREQPHFRDDLFLKACGFTQKDNEAPPLVG